MHASLYLVVGLGKTGLSIARYLKRRQLPFIVFDTRQQTPLADAFKKEFVGVELFLGDFPESLYSEIKTILCSPGVSLDEPFLQKARDKQIPISGDIDCLVECIDAPIIAITGTNGKSTVTTLVGEMVKAAGLRAAVAGNIGLPVLDMLDVGVQYDIWVLELSSFQLDITQALKPLAACILNVTPDHLDRHHTLEAYINAKQRVYRDANVIIYNRHDEQTKPVNNNPLAMLSNFGLNTPKAGEWGLITKKGETFLAKGDEPLLSVNELRIRGRHNWENALAACALAQAAGIGIEPMKAVLKRFAGLPHRCQWVRTLNGVDWVNDSKGTNVGASLSAIEGIGAALEGKVVWIAGGVGKGADFSELAPAVAQYVRTAILLGLDAYKIAQCLSKETAIVHVANLDEAITTARQHALPGDVVLMSPACASFDMFRDFNHRGDDFIAAVHAL